MKLPLPYITLLVVVLMSWSCKQRSPEKLPKLKESFKAQIASFEKQKEKANKEVTTGLEGLSSLQQAIKDAQNVDKEFNDVYGRWGKVNKKVESLNKEYEDLKTKAESLFAAIERQVNSLNDETTKKQLLDALGKSRTEYQATLVNTSKAIGDLRVLHAEALDIVKALEAAVAIGQIGEINEGLKSIEGRVASIMDELNITVQESKQLYDKKMGEEV